MTNYELLYIVSGSYTEAEVEAAKGRVAAIIEKYGAKILKHDALSKVRLSYPVKQEQYGTYILCYFEAETEKVAELNRVLLLSEEVVRHMLITEPSAEGMARKWELTSYVAPLSDEARKEREGASERVFAEKPVEAPVQTRELAGMNVAELDKKLDQLIDSDLTKNV